MISRAMPLLEWAAALGAGLMAGVFFAFSTFVMPALARLPAADGIRAMQEINRTALHKPFLLTFLATALACAVVAALSLAPLMTAPSITQWSDSSARYRLAACAVYLLGTFLVTVVANVPRNEALASLDPTSASSAAAWVAYVREWTTWNHLRAIAACVALVLFMKAR